MVPQTPEVLRDFICAYPAESGKGTKSEPRCRKPVAEAGNNLDEKAFFVVRKSLFSCTKKASSFYQ